MSDKPAIILITCDELRRDTLSFYGNRAISTENIDRFAGAAAVYDNCYTVSPLCLPARCSILTGLYPHQSGAYSNFRKNRLDGNLKNLFTELKQGGYQTAFFGKCHFAPTPYGDPKPDITLEDEELRDFYLSLGIDHLALAGGKMHSVWYYDDYSRALEKAGYLKDYRDRIWDKSLQRVFPFPGPAEWHTDHWTGDQACDFIEKADDKPLFAWVSFNGPHYPFDAPESYLRRVDTSKFWKQKIREGEHLDESCLHHKDYYGPGRIDGASQAPERACKNFTGEYWERLIENYNANVALIDDKVGDILRAVKKRYGDQALIIFTADHGEMLGSHGIWGKHDCEYDEVWKIPLFVQQPGKNEMKRSAELVNSLDIMPTCLEAAGQSPQVIPSAPAPGDGHSLIAEKTFRREYTFAESEGFIAVTDGRYKYVHFQKHGENYRELRDITADPDEFNNYINDPRYAGVLNKLREKVIKHFMPKVLP